MKPEPGVIEEPDEPPSLSLISEQGETASDSVPRGQIPFADSSEWRDWRWQMRNRIRSMSRLSERLSWKVTSPEAEKAAARFPLAITPYYASLIERPDASDPIFLMAVPQAEELWSPPFLRDDPLEEESDMPVPGLVHRYADRALLLATSTCAMYCRHCTRKRVAGSRECHISRPE